MQEEVVQAVKSVRCKRPFAVEFIDKHPGYSADGFSVVNEEHEMFTQMLRKQKISLGKMGSIISGGEILLLSFLAQADEVIGVDHSYRSIGAAFLKLLVLEKLGPKGFKAALGDPNTFTKHCNLAVKDLPEPLQAFYKKTCGATNWGSQWNFITTADALAIRFEWFWQSDRKLMRIIKKASKLKLIHGDLNDLTEFGPFDSLYTSNAHGHTNREKKYPKVSEWEGLVRDGGHLMMTKTDCPVMENFHDRTEKKGLRTQWYYVLARKSTPQVKAETSAQMVMSL